MDEKEIFEIIGRLYVQNLLSARIINDQRVQIENLEIKIKHYEETIKQQIGGENKKPE